MTAMARIGDSVPDASRCRPELLDSGVSPSNTSRHAAIQLTGSGGTMAEPVTRTPDFPDFDVYPGAPPRAERELPEHASRAREVRNRDVHNNDRLNHTAERIGGAVGSAVNQVQQMRDRFQVIRGRGTEAAHRELADRASQLADRASQIKDKAAQRAPRLP